MSQLTRSEPSMSASNASRLPILSKWGKGLETYSDIVQDVSAIIGIAENFESIDENLAHEYSETCEEKAYSTMTLSREFN